MDDVDSLEVLLAHSMPEGIANLMIPIAVYVAMFFVDWKLALLSLASIPISLIVMMTMYSVGMKKMGPYYMAGQKMNNTIIEYINGMEVVKVFNKDADSYERFRKDVSDYRDYTLAWYKAAWPWMAIYSSLLPCTIILNISNIISAIRKITQIPIIILTDTSSLLCMSWKKELIYAGADCVMDINSTTEEVDLQIFSLARRNNKQKITQKQSETMIDKGKLVMDHKKHKVFWNDVALHLTRQEYNFLYLLAATPMRVYTFEQIYQLVWKDYPVGDIKNIIWCLVKRLRKKLNVVEDGAGNCIVSVRDIGYKFELNKENEQQ